MCARLCFCVFSAILLMAAAGLTTVSFGTGAAFSDVHAWQWHAGAVEQARAEGILEGYPDGTFRPDRIVTCGEFLRMAIPEAPKTSAAHWAERYYREGLRRELFTGRDIGETSLDRPIARQHMALVYSRLLEETDPGLTGVQIARTEEGTVPSAPFSDVPAQSAYEYPIAIAAAAGLLEGYPDGTFRPEGYLTRAEAATAFVRLLSCLSDAAPGGVPPATPDEPDPAIADLADPVCLAYLDALLSSVRFEGSAGNYRYSFSAPAVAEGYKNFISVSFFSPTGKQILTEYDYKSRNKATHTFRNNLVGINSISEIGSLLVDCAITPLENECWVDYSLMWKGDDDIQLRIQYEDVENKKTLSEYIDSSFVELFAWK